MNQRLKQGLRKSLIRDGQQCAVQLRKHKAMLRRGVVVADDLEPVLDKAEATLALLAEQLEDVDVSVKPLPPHNGTVILNGVVYRSIEEVSHG